MRARDFAASRQIWMSNSRGASPRPRGVSARALPEICPLLTSRGRREGRAPAGTHGPRAV